MMICDRCAPYDCTCIDFDAPLKVEPPQEHSPDMSPCEMCDGQGCGNCSDEIWERQQEAAREQRAEQNRWYQMGREDERQ